MPHLPNTKEIAAARAVFRMILWILARCLALELTARPVPKLTAACYSPEWMDQVWTRDMVEGIREGREKRFVRELLARIARHKIIDRLLAGANRYGARQRIIDRLLRNAHRAVEGRAHDEDTQK